MIIIMIIIMTLINRDVLSLGRLMFFVNCRVLYHDCCYYILYIIYDYYHYCYYYCYC